MKEVSSQKLTNWNVVHKVRSESKRHSPEKLTGHLNGTQGQVQVEMRTLREKPTNCCEVHKVRSELKREFFRKLTRHYMIHKVRPEFKGTL